MYYFLTYLFVLISAKGSFLYSSNLYWFSAEILMLWVGIEKKRFVKADLKLFLTFSSIYIGFCTIRSLFLVRLSLSFWISDMEFLSKYILLSFLYCAVFKEKAISYLVRVIVQLAIISIPFYFLQLLSGDLIWGISKLINLPSVYPRMEYTNFLVFTYVREHAIRNSGFSWEPGAFGFFLNMGLLLHLLTNGFTFDKKARWLAFAIITTISTTSYLALMAIVFLYYRARGVKIGKLAVILVPVLCVLAFRLPFFFNKISFVYASDLKAMTRLQFLSKWYLERGQQLPLNRFGSGLFLYQIFGVNLIWGISNIYEDAAPILRITNISNGIFDFLSMYGLIGFVFFLSRCFMLFRKFTNSVELSTYGIVLILILGFSESIFPVPFTLCFFFLYFYSTPQEIPPDSETDLLDAGSINNSMPAY